MLSGAPFWLSFRWVAFWFRLFHLVFSASNYSAARDKTVELLITVSKIGTVFTTWVCVIPILISLWIQYAIIIPFKVEYNQSPADISFYTFIIGTLGLNVWVKIVLLGGVDDHWKNKLERVMNGGIFGIDLHAVYSDIFFPILNLLMGSLCVPYLFISFAKSQLGEIIPLVFLRYSYIIFSTFLICCYLFDQFIDCLTRLHTQLRDEKYLIGQQLENVQKLE